MPRRLNTDPELEALIQRLNSDAGPDQDLDDPQASTEQAAAALARPPWPLASTTPESETWLGDLLESARNRNASDLLLVAGRAPGVRINGQLQPLGKQSLSSSATEMLCSALLPASHRGRLEQSGSIDFAVARPGIGRLRCNVHRERGRWSAALRLLPTKVPDLSVLNLPPVLERFADVEHGMILVTGPTGSGKSTTLAALLQRILSRRKVHVITIEDPVEYTHPHGDSVVEHIEIGRDAPSFATALRSALRQDPDVLLVGEMRDRESISIAITAAETGHLVLSTLHTGDAPQTISRILDSYPAAQIDSIRTQLSISLAGIISQQLIPRVNGKGRVPATEVLLASDAARNLIRQGKIPNLASQLLLDRGLGSLPLDHSLARLVNEDLVELSQARPRARNQDEFDRLLR